MPRLCSSPITRSISGTDNDATLASCWFSATAPGIALYSLFLALLAPPALLSRFQRRLVGLGALMFVLSDLLIFARLGTLPDTLATGLAVWGLYYFGQLLICVGVAKDLKPGAE